MHDKTTKTFVIQSRKANRRTRDTMRTRDILTAKFLKAEGLRNSEIAARMGLSKSSVQTFLSARNPQGLL